MEYKYNETIIKDTDVVNLDDWIPKGEFNPHNIVPWLINEIGSTAAIALVFADSCQNALDMAVDNNKLDYFLIKEEDYADYKIHTDNPTCAFLGNAGEPFDLDTVEAQEIPNCPRSFIAQLAQTTHVS